MRRYRCVGLHVAASVLAFATVSTPASAQRRVTLSPGLAIGTGLQGSRVGETQRTSGRHAVLTLDIEAADVPVRLRAEAMAVVGPQAHGPVSLGASAVVPIGDGRLRPYALVGAGVYGVGGVGHPIGLTAGVGAEYRGHKTTAFLEARRHTESPAGISVGIRF
jgi:hypothetical protein